MGSGWSIKIWKMQKTKIKPILLSPYKGILKLPIIHCCVSLFLFISYKFNWLPSSFLGFAVLGYYMMFTFLFMYYYKSIKDYKIYLLWLGISLIQFFVYILNKSYKAFKIDERTSLSSLSCLFVFLILYQLFRQISLYTIKQEFIMDTKSRGDEVSSLEIVGSPLIMILSMTSMFIF